MASLLNASEATLFIYTLDRHFQDLLSQNRKNIKPITATMKNQVFLNNLRIIDSKLPEILICMLIDTLSDEEISVADAVGRITKENPMRYDLSYGQDLYGYKIKHLLVALAQGMNPATVGDGKYDASGIYTVVKEDGAIVRLQLADTNRLAEYLFYNTRFELPKPGVVSNVIKENEDGDLLIPIGFQIGFL